MTSLVRRYLKTAIGFLVVGLLIGGWLMARRELADIIRSLDVTTLLVTHDLPYALELCPRSVILSDGRVVADGPTADLLGDEELLAAHSLELPYGLDPAAHRPAALP